MTSLTIDDLVHAWDGEAVVVRFDAETRTWMFIALHSSRLGPPVGGCRMKTYDTPAHGLRDAMRLAEGMTSKWAALGMDCGGGKAVLAVPEPLAGEARRGLLERFGRLIGLLNGGFSTGRDLGTTDEDMLVIARVSSHVHGPCTGGDRARDPGPYTARGVLAAIRATVRRLDGDGNLAGRSVVVQGAGAVGAPLTRLLVEAGAVVQVADMDAGRAAALARETGAAVLDAGEVIGTACDIYAPCAVGATLNARTIPQLACRGVAGSANNQLGEAADADRLHDRGILYAPDYIANGGGAKAFWSMHRGVTDEAEIRRGLDAIGDVLDEIFAEAARRDESPAHAARRRVEAVLAAAGPPGGAATSGPACGGPPPGERSKP